MARLPSDPFAAAKSADDPFNPGQMGSGWGMPTPKASTPASASAASASGENPFAPTAPVGDFSPPQQGNFGGGGGGGGGLGSGWGDYYYNQDPAAGLSAFEQGHGIEATGAYGRFLGSQSNNLNAGYGAATVGNPSLNRLDYYAQQLPSLNNWYGVSQAASYSPFRRGR